MEKPNFEGFIDPSLPPFKYNEEDRERMRSNGLTDEEINQKEAMANLKSAESKVEAEMKAQGVRQEDGILEAISPEEAADIISQFDERGKDQAA